MTVRHRPPEAQIAYIAGRLDDLLRLTSDVFLETDAALIIRAASFRTLDIFGLPDVLVVGQQLENMGRFAQGMPDWQVPFTDLPFQVMSNGAERTLLISSLPYYDVSGRFAGVRAAAHDVTERLDWERQATMLMAACEQSPAAEAIVTSEGRLLWANARWRADDPQGAIARDLIATSPPSLEDGTKLGAAMAARKPWRCEVRRPKGEGAAVEMLSVSPITAPGQGTFFSLVREDITVRRAYEERLTHLAHFDELTGLPTRLLCLDRLNRALMAAERQASVVGVLLIAVSGLRRINDVHGRAVGDMVLMQLARRLQSVVRGSDTVARLSGAEFAVITDLRDGGEADALATKLQAAINTKFSFSGLDHHLTAKIGIALYPGDGDNAEAALHSATLAVSGAANSAKRIHFFRPEINEALQARLRMETALRNALPLGELAMHYQPIVDRTGRAVAAEALMRWFPRSRDPVGPGVFVPLAEETGVIMQLGLWGLYVSCAEAARWRSLDHEVRIAVNASPLQFHAPTFVDDILGALDAVGLPPHSLDLEITEGLLVDGSEEVIAVMHRLRDAGIGLVIDDFGTGYSSLSCLRRFPLTKLKIDRSFVGDIDTNGPILRAILTMSRSLGLAVVAEGVEESRQAEFLCEEGCDYMQGWLFGRDEPGDQFLRMLRQPHIRAVG